MGARELRRAARRARYEGRRGRREARGQAPADDAVHEAAVELVARHLVERDDRPCTRLALAVDAERRGERGDPGISGQEELVLVERTARVGVVLMNRPK